MSEWCWVIFGIGMLVATIVSGHYILKSVDDNHGYF